MSGLPAQGTPDSPTATAAREVLAAEHALDATGGPQGEHNDHEHAVALSAYISAASPLDRFRAALDSPEAVEAVARVICEKSYRQVWEHLHEVNHEDFRDEARDYVAALVAHADRAATS